MYWALFTQCFAISDIIEKQFETIKRYFQICDNTRISAIETPDFEPLHKVGPLVIFDFEKCRQAQQKDSNQAISNDETTKMGN